MDINRNYFDIDCINIEEYLHVYVWYVSIYFQCFIFITY